MFFDLSKFKSKNGKPVPVVQAQNIFELFIKNDKGQNEVSIMQFIQIGDKYYPLRYTLAGEGKTKINLSEKDIAMLSKKGNKNKGIAADLDKSRIAAYTVVEFLELMYGEDFATALVYQCTPSLWFDPISCDCGLPENIVNPFTFPELYLVVFYPFGDFVIDPYPFSFHPREITFDPEYPSGPIDPGTYDCAGVQNGTAYVDPNCGCIGGTTGITDCDLGDDPTIGASAFITEVSASAAAITTRGSSWGYTEDESVDLEIDASLTNGVWTAVLFSVQGNYSIQARLVPGVSEVGGTNSTNYCTQVSNLKALGNGSGVYWYMHPVYYRH